MNELDILVEKKVKEAMSQGSGRIVKRGHECDTPGVDFPTGTLWQCDCGKRFKLVDKPFDHNWKTTFTTKLSPRGRLGVGRLFVNLLVLVMLASLAAPAALAFAYGPEFILLYVFHLFAGLLIWAEF